MFWLDTLNTVTVCGEGPQDRRTLMLARSPLPLYGSFCDAQPALPPLCVRLHASALLAAP